MLARNCTLSWYGKFSRKETIEKFYYDEEPVEEIEMSSRTTSYIEGIGDNEESVVAQRSRSSGVEDDTPSFEYNNDNSIDDNIKNSQKFTNELLEKEIKE